MKPTVGRIVHCWPERYEATPEGETSLTCAAIVCGVKEEEDSIAVHYYLPDGANGACELPLAEASGPERGKWWWPPRA